MATQTKQYEIDAEGTNIVSDMLVQLLNRFPGLRGRKIDFSTLPDASGIAFFPTTGAVFMSNIEDVTGHVRQVCTYPFNVVYRFAPKTDKHRLRTKEFLDTLGKWLERQPVIINGVTHQLDTYPILDQNRTIKTIVRTNPSYLNSAYQDGIEDWVIAITLRYEAEYDK